MRRTGGRVVRYSMIAMFACALSSQAAEHYVPSPDPNQGDGRVSTFYSWEKAIPNQPGSLLRTEPLPAEIGLTGASKQLRILYSSTDGVRGNIPNVVSGALYIPKGKPPANGWPVVAWAHGTVGLADYCAPSWSGGYHRVNRYLNTWLAEGFAVVATDYQGLGVPGPHPLINIPALAYGVLDSARAVINGVPGLDNKVLIVGQSQGGAGAVAAASYAAQYAPELGIKGTVATGVIYYDGQRPLSVGTPDPHKVDTALAYRILSFVVDQQLDPTLEATDVFKPKALPLVDQARNRCLSTLMSDVEAEGLTAAEALHDAPNEKYQKFQEKFAEQRKHFREYPTLKLPHPLFIGTGANDLTPAATSQLKLMRDACAAGSVVEGHLYAGLGHSPTVLASLKHSVPFAHKVISGQEVTPVCQPILE